MSQKINIIIVDDNPAFLKGISTFISKDNRFYIIDQLNDGLELLKHDELGLADLVLLDIEMPRLNGIETAKQVNYRFPEIKIIAITMYQDKVYLRQLLEAGFNGFVSKTTVPQGLFTTMEAVLQDKFLFPDDINL